MKIISFNQKKNSKIALEFDELIPDKIYNWEKSDFDKYKVPIGNSKFPLSDYFDVKVEGEAEFSNQVKMVLNGNLGRVKYIGAKMTDGQIIANGNVDLHCGAEMSGGSILVNGNAESYAGREMTGGELEIMGNVKELCGSSYIGDWRGMTGGTITIHGNAGKQLGECLTGGKIYVKGNCDILPGIHMSKGLIQIDGDVNRWPGSQMQNGDIVINGTLLKFFQGFIQEEIVKNPTIVGKSFQGEYIRCTGDIASNGKGNLWLALKKNECLI
ncbi:MAG: formylmethanofuran dehydrogenase subunit C [Methanobrevibacter sp.]|nr:formylmethanofuran dehydrogenase subunit C [Methanobrevibacter sp.]